MATPPSHVTVWGRMQGHLVITDFGCSKMSDENGSVRTASWAGDARAIL